MTNSNQKLSNCFLVEVASGFDKVTVDSWGADGRDPWNRALANQIMSAIVRAIHAGEIGGYFPDQFADVTPQISEGGFQVLREALRHADTAAMTKYEVIDFCEAKVPGCTIEEIVQALGQVGDEQLQEADRLSRIPPPADY